MNDATSRALAASATQAGAADDATFHALYYPELLHEVNPAGDVGLITLWSPQRTALRKLDAISPEILDPDRSRVAVVSNLYGDGLFAMLCNLLYNPQVRHLVAIGEHLGLSTCDEIEAFLERGLEDDVMLGVPVKRIRGTERVFPVAPEFDAQRLRATLSFRYLGRLSRPELASELHRPAARPAPHRCRCRRARGCASRSPWLSRTTTSTCRPSRPPTRSSGAGRWTAGRSSSCASCASAGRSSSRQARAWSCSTRRRSSPIQPTTPSRRWRSSASTPGGFALMSSGSSSPTCRRASPTRTATACAATSPRRRAPRTRCRRSSRPLRRDPRTRGAYVSLWDSAADLPQLSQPEHPATPCLTTLFFRVASDRLTLTATYRAHNLLTAWLENVYGLMAIQRHVAAGAGHRDRADHRHQPFARDRPAQPALRAGADDRRELEARRRRRPRRPASSPCARTPTATSS